MDVKKWKLFGKGVNKWLYKPVILPITIVLLFYPASMLGQKLDDGVSKVMNTISGKNVQAYQKELKQTHRVCALDSGYKKFRKCVDTLTKLKLKIRKHYENHSACSSELNEKKLLNFELGKLALSTKKCDQLKLVHYKSKAKLNFVVDYRIKNEMIRVKPMRCSFSGDTKCYIQVRDDFKKIQAEYCSGEGQQNLDACRDLKTLKDGMGEVVQSSTALNKICAKLNRKGQKYTLCM